MDIESTWVSYPEDWQPLFYRWHEQMPEQSRLHTFPQAGGEKVIGLTLGIPKQGAISEAREKRLLLAVPHAHEPAGTAVIVDIACELVNGKHLDGSSSQLLGKELLSRVMITLLPDTNPGGRVQSPYRVWNGQCDNETFYRHVFGIDARGERFGRYPEWRVSEKKPEKIGIIYEKLDEDLYVEPNTSRRSTHTRAIDTLFEEFNYTHMLEMHQHENPEAVLLPPDFEDLPEESRLYFTSWAEAIISSWQKIGGFPHPEPYIPYKGQQRQEFFRSYWEGRCPGMRRITTEVRNNRDSKTGEAVSMERQWRTARAALMTTLAFLIAE